MRTIHQPYITILKPGRKHGHNLIICHHTHTSSNGKRTSTTPDNTPSRSKQDRAIPTDTSNPANTWRTTSSTPSNAFLNVSAGYGPYTPTYSGVSSYTVKSSGVTVKHHISNPFPISSNQKRRIRITITTQIPQPKNQPRTQIAHNQHCDTYRSLQIIARILHDSEPATTTLFTPVHTRPTQHNLTKQIMHVRRINNIFKPPSSHLPHHLKFTRPTLR